MHQSQANASETANVCVRLYGDSVTAKVGCLPSELISVNHSQAGVCIGPIIAVISVCACLHLCLCVCVCLHLCGYVGVIGDTAIGVLVCTVYVFSYASCLVLSCLCVCVCVCVSLPPHMHWCRQAPHETSQTQRG